MKANYKPINRSEARKIAKQETEAMYEQIFADCASDVMQQVIANVLLSMERDYDYTEEQLKEFIHNVKRWINAMQEPSGLSRGWTTDDNIDYFKEQYGIDLRKEFVAEVSAK